MRLTPCTSFALALFGVLATTVVGQEGGLRATRHLAVHQPSMEQGRRRLPGNCNGKNRNKPGCNSNDEDEGSDNGSGDDSNGDSDSFEDSTEVAAAATTTNARSRSRSRSQDSIHINDFDEGDINNNNRIRQPKRNNGNFIARSKAAFNRANNYRKQKIEQQKEEERQFVIMNRAIHNWRNTAGSDLVDDSEHKKLEDMIGWVRGGENKLKADRQKLANMRNKLKNDKSVPEATKVTIRKEADQLEAGIATLQSQLKNAFTTLDRYSNQLRAKEMKLYKQRQQKKKELDDEHLRQDDIDTVAKNMYRNSKFDQDRTFESELDMIKNVKTNLRNNKKQVKNMKESLKNLRLKSPKTDADRQEIAQKQKLLRKLQNQMDEGEKFLKVAYNKLEADIVHKSDTTPIKGLNGRQEANHEKWDREKVVKNYKKRMQKEYKQTQEEHKKEQKQKLQDYVDNMYARFNDEDEIEDMVDKAAVRQKVFDTLDKAYKKLLANDEEVALAHNWAETNGVYGEPDE